MLLFNKLLDFKKSITTTIIFADPLVRAILDLDLPKTEKLLQQGKRSLPASANLLGILVAAKEAAITIRQESAFNTDILMVRMVKQLERHGLLSYDYPALMAFVRLDNVELIKHAIHKIGLSPDGDHPFKYPPLFKAAERNSARAFDFLLEVGADPLKPSYNGYSLLMALASLDRQGMVESMFSKITPEQRDALLLITKEVQGKEVVASQFAPYGEPLSRFLEQWEIKALIKAGHPGSKPQGPNPSPN